MQGRGRDGRDMEGFLAKLVAKPEILIMFEIWFSGVAFSAFEILAIPHMVVFPTDERIVLFLVDCDV